MSHRHPFPPSPILIFFPASEATTTIPHAHTKAPISVRQKQQIRALTDIHQTAVIIIVIVSVVINMHMLDLKSSLRKAVLSLLCGPRVAHGLGYDKDEKLNGEKVNPVVCIRYNADDPLSCHFCDENRPCAFRCRPQGRQCSEWPPDGSEWRQISGPSSMRTVINESEASDDASTMRGSQSSSSSSSRSRRRSRKRRVGSVG
ncbi:hypothetical protein F4778DRAFT_480314 [Xylariomycetidae sp. FL2044]|nr:hypothetical protein F4778DRAFT_480314 [Xylariomycetidae sp. FL2044]